jgi:hypothetical protein
MDKVKKPFYKKWLFWTVAVFAMILISSQINKNSDGDRSVLANADNEAEDLNEIPNPNAAESTEDKNPAKKEVADAESAQMLTDQLSTYIACVDAGEQLGMIGNGNIGQEEDVKKAIQLAEVVISSNASLAKALIPAIKERRDGNIIWANANLRKDSDLEAFKRARESGNIEDARSLVQKWAKMMSDECQN